MPQYRGSLFGSTGGRFATEVDARTTQQTAAARQELTEKRMVWHAIAFCAAVLGGEYKGQRAGPARAGKLLGLGRAQRAISPDCVSGGGQELERFVGIAMLESANPLERLRKVGMAGDAVDGVGGENNKPPLP